MTYDDDSIHIDGRTYSLRAVNLEWPPPERLYINFVGEGIARCVADEADAATRFVTYRRISMSIITDEQRRDMTHVFRGAEYERVLGDGEPES